MTKTTLPPKEAAIAETYDDVRGLLQTASWEVMDEDQRDDVIAKIVVPRWGKTTADGVVLKGTAWGKLLGTTMSVIEARVRRLRASDQGKSASASNGPQPNQRASIRSAKASIKKHPELAKSLLADPEVAAAVGGALPPEKIVDAFQQSPAAQVEHTRRQASRHGSEWRDRQQASLEKLAADAKAMYNESETGTSDVTAQDIIRITNNLRERRLRWALEGAKRSADLVSALSGLQAETDEFRQEATGTGPVTISAEDQQWADEFGIDLGVTQ